MDARRGGEDGAAGGGGFFERSPEQDYFQSLESLMIELRGAPLQLSPDDWQVSKEWLAAKIPLDLVAETVREIVERRREQEKEVPRRLRYYRRAVEKAWQEVEALKAPGTRAAGTKLDVAGRLSNLAAHLEAASWLEGDVPASVRALGEDAGEAEPSTEAVEKALEDLDAELMGLAEASLDEAARGRLASRLEAALAAHADRLPEAPSEAVRRRLRGEILRREKGLPVLSLFAPEALAPPAPGAGEVESSGRDHAP